MTKFNDPSCSAMCKNINHCLVAINLNLQEFLGTWEILRIMVQIIYVHLHARALRNFQVANLCTRSCFSLLHEQKQIHLIKKRNCPPLSTLN